ncbi:MAG: globin domain-containing protein [Methylococcales bacterium]|nr:globin domain-containing protein [Methylococcales bacterium]
MSTAHRQLVKANIESLGSNIDKLSQLFYRELFHIDINLKNVFPGNVVFLNRKFANMLATFKNTAHLEKITASVEKMGERHSLRYGVSPDHFASVEQALLLALRQYFGENFSPALDAAWQSVFAEVSAIMKVAMANTPLDEASSGHYDETTYDSGLLAEVGGKDGILRVHQRFYAVIFKDPWLGKFFWGKHEDVLAEKQSQFMVAAFGGENMYRGDTPAFVHMHMFITDEMSDLRQAMLKQAILDEGFSESVAERWLKVDDSFRSSIVKQSIDECVLKCLGQVPVTAEKPIAYRPAWKSLK